MPSGVFPARGDKNCATYSYKVVADTDHVRPRVRLKTLRLSIEQDEHVHSVFVSPSGDGVKAVVAVAGGLHPTKLRAVGRLKKFWQKYFKQKFGVTIDPKCVNVERVCFVSYDPLARWKADAAPLEPVDEAPPEPEKPVNIKPKSKQSKPAERESEVENEADLDQRREIARVNCGPNRL